LLLLMMMMRGKNRPSKHLFIPLDDPATGLAPWIYWKQNNMLICHQLSSFHSMLLLHLLEWTGSRVHYSNLVRVIHLCKKFPSKMFQTDFSASLFHPQPRYSLCPGIIFQKGNIFHSRKNP
jgi:hypothetical protein